MSVTMKKLLSLENSDALLKQYLEEQLPIDIAYEMRDIDEDDFIHIFSLCDTKRIAEILESGDDDDRMRFCKKLSDDQIYSAFKYMAKDDIVDILGDLSIGRRKSIMKAMRYDEQNQIETLLQYPEDSAGGIMTTDYIALRDTMSVEQSLQKIREIGPKTEVLETIYVINSYRQLVGKCDLRDLFSHSRAALLKDIMSENVKTLRPEDDQEEAARIVAKYDLRAVPVISEKNQILGIITVDDVIDVIIEEDDEDMLSLAGVNAEENIYTTLSQSIKMRLPWLLINLATAFLASLTVKAFENTIAQVVALSAIMTIVTGMGGNAGTQTQSIMVRQLADDDLKLSNCVKPFLKEVTLGLVDGTVNGLAAGIIVILVYGNFWLGVIVLLAMIGNLIIASAFGFIIPIVLKRLGADPAVSSSIFLTTATDVLGFFLFLSLAQIFMPLLL